MVVIETSLAGCLLIKPKVYADARGYFYESFNQRVWEQETGLQTMFVQDNEALSNYGVIRGLHYQHGEAAQAKLVRVLTGKVLDVVVDIRPDSPTYGKHVAVELSAENKFQLFVPRGMAHGYAVLEDNTRFSYKCDNYYSKEFDRGVFYADEVLGIDWRIPLEARILSEKDMGLPSISARAERESD
jgi:dTDP-4-dehydrorhamnose 3,5-epimerase